MRSNAQYIQKVHEELSPMQKRLKQGDDFELTETQEENWDKINIIWKLLKDGNSDSEVLKLAKNHPGLAVMERRARELLYLTYQTFADLRLSRDVRAIKILDSESYREAAAEVMDDIKKIRKSSTLEDDKKYDFIKKFMKVWKELKVEAGKIDGVNKEDSKNQEEKKKPRKIVIRKLVVNNNFQNPPKEPPQDITYELEST